MIRIDGVLYRTISDAAGDFKVSPRTVRNWIDKGIIPAPPLIEHGVRNIEVFGDEFMKAAELALKDLRAKKSRRE